MNTDKIYAESIAKEYVKKDDSKVVALKKLDKKAKLPSNAFAYTFCIIGALALGVGMCLAMKVIGSGNAMFILGIIIGLGGILLVSINYPIYKKILEDGKKKYAYDILKLAREISEE